MAELEKDDTESNLGDNGNRDNDDDYYHTYSDNTGIKNTKKDGRRIKNLSKQGVSAIKQISKEGEGNYHNYD
jgi:hypothetical protein